MSERTRTWLRGPPKQRLYRSTSADSSLPGVNADPANPEISQQAAPALAHPTSDFRTTVSLSSTVLTTANRLHEEPIEATENVSAIQTFAEYKTVNEKLDSCTMAERKQIPEYLLKAIPIFDGSCNALCDFLDVVTGIQRSYVTKNTNVDTKKENEWLLHHIVKSKLTCSAKDIVTSRQCSNLDEVLEVLKVNFSDQKPVVTLIADLWKIKSRPNQHPLEFLDFLNSKRNIVITKYRLDNVAKDLLVPLIEQLDKQLVLIYLKNISDNLAMQLECMRAQTLEECRLFLTQNCVVGLENSLKRKTNSEPRQSYTAPNAPRQNSHPNANYGNNHSARQFGHNNNNSGNGYHTRQYGNNSFGNRYDSKQVENYKPNNSYGFRKPFIAKGDNSEARATPVKREPNSHTQSLNATECLESLTSVIGELRDRLNVVENHFLEPGHSSVRDTS
jgi:hypothetical protein